MQTFINGSYLQKSSRIRAIVEIVFTNLKIRQTIPWLMQIQQGGFAEIDLSGIHKYYHKRRNTNIGYHR